MRCPSSPGHGGASRPGISFWNFLQNTVRPLVGPEGEEAGVDYRGSLSDSIRSSGSLSAVQDRRKRASCVAIPV